MNVIEVHNLSKVYREGDTVTTALDNVSFNIEKGAFVAIMGPSGSGKSTLLHLLGLLDEASSGVYLFNGKDVCNLSRDESAVLRNQEIGFVFQAFNLLSRTSVL